MKQIHTLLTALGGIFIISIFAWIGFDRQAERLADDERMVVAATIFPLADIAERIGGDRVRVVQIVPSGASPHSYSVVPQQVSDINQAKALFHIGYGLDDAIVTSLQRSRGNGDDMEIIAVDSGIVLREFGDGHHHDDEDHGHDGHHDEDEHDDDDHDHEHDYEGDDPHYWLSVPNAQLIAVNIGEALASLDPENADYYYDNMQAYVAELDELEEELQQLARSASQTSFVAMHDAWGYFAEQYGFEMVGTYEPIEGREPSPADLRDLRHEVEEHGITVFYAEPQKASSAAMRVLEQDLGLRILILDPVGGIDFRDSYVDLMRFNVEAIANPS